MGKTMDWKFFDADLYGGEGDERLSFEDPEEWVEREFDGRLPFRATNEQVEDALDGLVLTCVGFVHEKVTPAWTRRVAEGLADTVRESFGEDYGDPDDYERDFTKEGHATLVRALDATITRVVREHAHVWRCTEVGRHDYDEDAVREILGPRYFEDLDAKPPAK